VNPNNLLVSLPADKLKQIWAEAVGISNITSLLAHLLSHFMVQQSRLFHQSHCSTAACREIYKQQQSGLQGSYSPSYNMVEGPFAQVEWENLPEQVIISLDASPANMYTTKITQDHYHHLLDLDNSSVDVME